MTDTAATVARILDNAAAPGPCVPASSAELANRDRPRDTAHNAMDSDETYATFWRDYTGPASAPSIVATLGRPFRGPDAGAPEPAAAGLVRLTDPAGRRVAVFARIPTVEAVRVALRAFARADAGIADMTAEELAAEEADATARVVRNVELALSTSFDTFRASALTRAFRAARRAAAVSEELARRYADAMESAHEAEQSGATPEEREEAARAELAPAPRSLSAAATPEELKAAGYADTGESFAAFRARMDSLVRDVAPAFPLYPVSEEAARLVLDMAAPDAGATPEELAADAWEDDMTAARDCVAVRLPGGPWRPTAAATPADIARLS